MKLINSVVAAALALSVGCSVFSPEKPASADDHVRIESDDLRDVLVRMPATIDFEADGRLKVTTPVKLAADLDRSIQYRYTFVDAEGKTQSSDTDFQTVKLAAGRPTNLTADSPAAGARDYLLIIRPVQPK